MIEQQQQKGKKETPKNHQREPTLIQVEAVGGGRASARVGSKGRKWEEVEEVLEVEARRQHGHQHQKQQNTDNKTHLSRESLQVSKFGFLVFTGPRTSKGPFSTALASF